MNTQTVGWQSHCFLQLHNVDQTYLLYDVFPVTATMGTFIKQSDLFINENTERYLN